TTRVTHSQPKSRPRSTLADRFGDGAILSEIGAIPEQLSASRRRLLQARDQLLGVGVVELFENLGRQFRASQTEPATTRPHRVQQVAAIRLVVFQGFAVHLRVSILPGLQGGRVSRIDVLQVGALRRVERYVGGCGWLFPSLLGGHEPLCRGKSVSVSSAG